MNQAIYNSIIERFAARINHASSQGEKLKPTSAKFQQRQAEFFAGAMSALVAVFEQSPADIEKIFNDAVGPEVKTHAEYVTKLHGKAMPPSWVISIMRGDNIIDTLKKPRIFESAEIIYHKIHGRGKVLGYVGYGDDESKSVRVEFDDQVRDFYPPKLDENIYVPNVNTHV